VLPTLPTSQIIPTYATAVVYSKLLYYWQ